MKSSVRHPNCFSHRHNPFQISDLKENNVADIKWQIQRQYGIAKSMALFLITFAFPLKAPNLSLPWWLVSGFYQGNHLLFKEQEKCTSWLGFLLSLTDSEMCSLPVSTSRQEIMAYYRFHPLIVPKKEYCIRFPEVLYWH